MHDNVDYFFAYTLTNENGIDTCFLIDFKEKKKSERTFERLKYAIRSLRNLNVDLIIFVGEITFYNLFFLRLPQFVEPRKLPLIIDVLNKEMEIDLLNGSNWTFDLYNFDVR